MSRVVLAKGKQRAFLVAVKEALGGGVRNLAFCLGVHARTVRDWQCEKYLISQQALTLLQKISGVACPTILEVLPDYWSTSKAGQVGSRRRSERYGNPGTAEGRRRGGFISYEKLRASGALTGFQLRKTIVKPKRSSSLAEFIGIVLGDGGVTDRQVTITLNAVTDREYADFVVRVVSQLFGLTPSRRTRENACVIVMSRVELVEFLQNHGVVQGNKVRHQVDVPSWILEGPCYVKACLRGLMDTDGSVYSSHHTIGGTKYKHVCICFTNYSKPLLASVHRMLSELGYHPTRARNRVFLYRQQDIHRYFKEVGTQNPKHLRRYQDVAGLFLSVNITTRPDLRRGAGVAITGRS